MFKQSHTERSNHSADVCAGAHQAEAHLDHLTEYLQGILHTKQHLWPIAVKGIATTCLVSTLTLMQLRTRQLKVLSGILMSYQYVTAQLQLFILLSTQGLAQQFGAASHCLQA